MRNKCFGNDIGDLKRNKISCSIGKSMEFNIRYSMFLPIGYSNFQIRPKATSNLKAFGKVFKTFTKKQQMLNKTETYILTKKK